ncbi:hypothetical protein F0U44_09465 [Nocardioides humilatus]|uniref:EfeO-type cupredoxin-like domain-containing protein n=1 Tax=Nocardioides humilatus TaxID=2607660 RepID=A0A5B1LEH2_9ACTN|nr:hypothetical protein [Nocardioides humilatus]KAA1418714.1 hypothetical protein F0U44_09465 [Nocardioides humilatus]
MAATTARWIALAIVVGAGLTGCSDDGGSDKKSDEKPVFIQITIQDGQVTPNGDRVDVSPGQPIDLEVIADAPGEIHVHSDPEQEFEYDAGTTQLDEFEISRPGIVAVESHTLDQVIVQLEVK